MGTGLGVIRLSPTTSLKLGVTYLDRNNIKILPAGGILWKPTPNSLGHLFPCTEVVVLSQHDQQSASVVVPWRGVRRWRLDV